MHEKQITISIDIIKGFKTERKNMNPIGTFSPIPELGVLALA